MKMPGNRDPFSLYPAKMSIGNDVSDVSAAVAAMAALATVGLAAWTLKVAIVDRKAAQSDRVAAAVDRQAAERDREEAERDRQVAEADRTRARADRERDRYRDRLERIAVALADLHRSTGKGNDDWKWHRGELRILTVGLNGKFPSIDAILNTALVITDQMAANAAGTARLELQVEIEHVAREQASAWNELTTQGIHAADHGS